MESDIYFESEPTIFTEMRAAVQKAGQDGWTPEKVVALAENATDYAQARLRERESIRTPQLACRAGCPWCCSLKVSVIAIEVFRLAAFLRRDRSPEDLTALIERLREVESRTRGLSTAQHNRLRVLCPLLEENACSVHPERPLTCRGYNSTNVERCHQLYLDGEASIPFWPQPIRVMGVARAGIRQGLVDAGLRGEPLELVAALRIALTEPDALQRWLAGEPLFAEALYIPDADESV